MPRLYGLCPPAVVPPIGEPNRRLQELLGRRIVECAQLDGNVVSADLLDVSAAKRPNAAMPAEQVMPALCSELIVAQIGLARKQAEIIGFDNDAPVSRLRTDRAVALSRASAQIDVRLVAYCAAVATTVVGFLHAFAP